MSLLLWQEVFLCRSIFRKNECTWSNECDRILREYFTIWLKNLQQLSWIQRAIKNITTFITKLARILWQLSQYLNCNRSIIHNLHHFASRAIRWYRYVNRWSIKNYAEKSIFTNKGCTQFETQFWKILISYRYFQEHTSFQRQFNCWILFGIISFEHQQISAIKLWFNCNDTK